MKHTDLHDKQKIVSDVQKIVSQCGPGKEAWDALEAEAVVFHLHNTAEAGRILRGYPEDQMPVLVAPFPVFKIVIDSPTTYTIPNPGKVQSTTIDLTNITPGMWLVDARETPWLVYDKVRIGLHWSPLTADTPERSAAINDILDRNHFYRYMDPTAFDPETGEFSQGPYAAEPLGARDGVTDFDGPVLTGPGLVRALCAFANHQDVTAVYMVDPNRPPTRQLRRSQNYHDTEHYRITIRGKAERIWRDVAAGVRTRVRREHQVRGHLRYSQSGRVSRVRPHHRCRGVGEFIRRDYAVASELP